MDYASKYIGLLPLPSLSKCVTASASVTQQVLSVQSTRSKPFRVTNAERSLKKGLTAHALEDLLYKVKESLNVSNETVLVLEEDGTEISSEDFFQTVPENSVLMVLDKGQKWTPLLVIPNAQLRKCGKDRTDVAKFTIDFYKTSPKDFIGCLNVKATFYGAYSVSYDVRCYPAKKLFKEAMRWTLFSMQATGHVLLGSSCYIEQLLEADDAGKLSLMLPPDSVVKHLQALVPRRFLY